MFRSQIIRLSKIFIPKNNVISLGRWEHRISDKQKEMKIIWANADHCGDHICGKPYHISTNIKYYTEKAPITKK